MMRPSQNFLLYNGTTMEMIKKEKFKLEWQSPHPFCNTCTVYELYQLNLKKRADDCNTAKYNHKCTKEINLLPSSRFYKKFLNEFFFLKKNEKESINLI